MSQNVRIFYQSDTKCQGRFDNFLPFESSATVRLWKLWVSDLRTVVTDCFVDILDGQVSDHCQTRWQA